MPRIILLVLVTVLFISNISVAYGKQYPALFVFGDSFYDTGNGNYVPTARHANFPPFGETYFKEPTGRFCDGRLIPDFIAKYAHLPFPLPYLQPGLTSYTNGVDFACPGAGALDDTSLGTVITLKMQVENYKKMGLVLEEQYGREISKAILSKAVYLFNIGMNDYLYPLAIATNSVTLDAKFVALVVGNLTESIKEVYKLGGRKFAFNNVGPLGCFPAVKAVIPPVNGSTCVEEVLQLVMLHNQLLPQALCDLAKEYKDFKYGLFDLYTNLKNMMFNPNAYGIDDGMTACCGSGPYRGIFSCGGQGNLTTYELCRKPKEHVFWDSVHPSDRAYKNLASLMWKGTPVNIAPYNVKTLFRMQA